ncbi:hypothetical protein ABIE27_002364 [Paenibacillus sp. 4624]|jgi:hypothetical protein
MFWLTLFCVCYEEKLANNSDMRRHILVVIDK